MTVLKPYKEHMENNKSAARNTAHAQVIQTALRVQFITRLNSNSLTVLNRYSIPENNRND